MEKEELVWGKKWGEWEGPFWRGNGEMRELLWGRTLDGVE